MYTRSRIFTTGAWACYRTDVGGYDAVHACGSTHSFASVSDMIAYISKVGQQESKRYARYMQSKGAK